MKKVLSRNRIMNPKIMSWTDSSGSESGGGGASAELLPGAEGVPNCVMARSCPNLILILQCNCTTSVSPEEEKESAVTLGS